MPQEIELQRMISRLVGDSTSFTAMLRQAERDAAITAREVTRASNQIEAISGRIEGFARVTTTVLGGLGAIDKLKSALYAFADLESAQIKLGAAIQATGQDLDSTMDSYKRFATVMLEDTGVSQASTLSLLQQAQLYGLTGDSAKRAVRELTGAQAAGLPINMRMIAAFHEGHTEMLSRYIPALRGVKDNTERVAIAAEFFNNIMEVGKAQLNTFSGQVRLLQGLWAMFQASLGDVIATALKPMITWLQETVRWLNSLSSEAKTNIVIILGVVAAILTLVPAFRALSFIYGVALFNPFILALIAATIAAVAFAHEVGGWGNAINAAYAYILQLVGILKELWSWTVRWVEENRTHIATVAALAAVYMTVWATIRIGIFLFGLIWSALALLRVQQIVSIALWLAWNAVVLYARILVITFQAVMYTGTILWIAWKAVTIAATAVMIAFNVAVFAVKVALLVLYLAMATVAVMLGFLTVSQYANMIGTVAWAVVILLAKAAVWLFNIALSATNILLGVFAVLVTALVAGGIASVFILGAIAIWAAYQALAAAMNVLLALPTAYGPIAHIAGLFGEWFDILKTVFQVMTIDMDLAMRLMYAGFDLAINEVKDLWPPLWQFIKVGFDAVWEYTKNMFLAKMLEGIAAVEEAAAIMMKVVFQLPDAVVDPIKDMAKADKEAAAHLADTSGKLVEQQMKNAINAFKVMESDATKDARSKVDKLNKEAKDKVAAGRKKDEADAYDYGEETGEAIAKGLRDSKFDAALRFSAEAFTRLQSWADTLREASGGGMGSPTSAVPAQGMAKADDRNGKILADIRDVLKGIRDDGPMQVRAIDLNA